MTNINKSLILSAIIATIATVMVGALSTTLQSANAEVDTDTPTQETNVKAKQKLKQDCLFAGCQQSACILVGENNSPNACRQQFGGNMLND
jgi:hypothetical protein